MIPIGKFSAFCQCSVKTLRNYDRIGLLVPAKIDENTGYRYYEACQLEEMALINRYKRYGFSLDQIHVLLNGSSKDRMELFKAQISNLYRQRDVLERCLNGLSILLQYAKNAESSANHETKESMMKPFETYAVDLCQRQRQPILSVRGRFGVGDFGQYFGQLFETAHQEQIKLLPVTGARYFDQEFDPASNDTEVFAFVEDEVQGDAFLPAGTYMHTIHRGEYSRLSEANAALTKWMDEQGYLAAGAPWELQTQSVFSGTPVEDWQTDVFSRWSKVNYETESQVVIFGNS